MLKDDELENERLLKDEEISRLKALLFQIVKTVSAMHRNGEVLAIDPSNPEAIQALADLTHEQNIKFIIKDSIWFRLQTAYLR